MCVRVDFFYQLQSHECLPKCIFFLKKKGGSRFFATCYDCNPRSSSSITALSLSLFRPFPARLPLWLSPFFHLSSSLSLFPCAYLFSPPLSMCVSGSPPPPSSSPWPWPLSLPLFEDPFQCLRQGFRPIFSLSFHRALHCLTRRGEEGRLVSHRQIFEAAK